jgi:hypothetical protein
MRQLVEENFSIRISRVRNRVGFASINKYSEHSQSQLIKINILDTHAHVDLVQSKHLQGCVMVSR